MKLISSIVPFFFLTGLVAGATEAVTDACCAAAKPAKPACCAAAASTTARQDAPLAPVSSRSLYQVDASWTNDAGGRVQLATLRGQPVIMAMFFASCEYACPMLVNDIQRTLEALPASVREASRVVLVSFDTERDTPEALRAYRERMGLDAQWTLLRGDETDVQELAMLLGVKFKRDARGQFAHSNLLTLLNPQGEIAFQRPGLQGDISELAKAVELSL
jgi:protein SCO1/2